jgi:uncharacterized membrane protein
MGRKSSRFATQKTWIVFGLVTAILLVPVVVYIHTFGFTITSNHVRWSEMGSAMAGIYTPILTVLTLLVLLAQVGLQEKMNRHTFDHAFVQDARSDVHFYLDQIAKELGRIYEDGRPIGPTLIEAFSYSTNPQLLAAPLCDIAKALNKKQPGLLASWSAFYSVLAGVGVHDWHPYKNAHIGAKQKAIAILSYAGCAALDNYAFAASEGRLKYCEFVTELAEPQ